MNELEQLKQHARDAISGHTRAVAGLYVAGEVPKFDAERMGEIIRHFDSERDRALSDIEARGRAIYRERQAAVEIAGQFSPDAILTSSERSEASERLSLAEADLGGMTDGQLASRLEGVLENGSKVERFVYLQAARRRAREDENRRASGETVVQVSEAGTPFDNLVFRLEETLIGPERARRQEQAAGRLEEANEVLEACYLGRHGAKNVADAYAMQNYHQAPAEHSQLAPGNRRIAGTNES